MAEVAAKFTADISGYKSAMSRMSNSTTSATKSASSLGSKVSSVMKKVGKRTMAAGAATTAMGVSALRSYGTFQNSLNKAGVVAGGTSKDIKGLADMANKMGADLPLSAQDAADAMISMAQDGASIKTIKKEFPAIARAATATGADLQQTAGTVQQAMNIWGESLKSPERAAAILTETANLSNASVESMSGAISNIGGVSKLAGYGMTEMTESIGLLTNRGFTARRASRNLSHAILSMQAPSGKAASAMKELGITYNDSSGKLKPFKTILNEVADATDGMGKSQKAAALKTLFGAAGMNAIAPLLDSVKDKTGNTATSWDAYADAMTKASKDGDTSHEFLIGQAGEMQKNIGAKLDQISGNWESLRNKSMASESTITGGMADMINKTLSWSSESSSGIAKVVRGFMGLAPAIGPAVTATGTFILYGGQIVGVAKSAVKGIARLGTRAASAAGRLRGAGKAAKTTNSRLAPMTQATKSSASAAGASATNFLKMGAAVALIGAGVLAAAAGIAILVKSAISLAKAGTKAQVAMAALAAGIAALAGVFALLGPALTANAVGIGVFGAAVLATGGGVAAFGVGVNKVAKAIALLSDKMSSIIPVMSAMGAGFAAMLTSFIEGILTAAPQISAAFINMIVKMMDQLATAAPQMTASFMRMLTGMITAVAKKTPKLVAAFSKMIVSSLNAITKQMPKFIKAGADFIVSILNGIAKNIGKIVTAAVNVVVKFINGIVNNLSRIINAGVNLIGKFIDGMVSAIPKIVNIAVNAVMKFVYGVGYAIGKVLGSGHELINQFISGVKSGLSSAHSAGKSAGDAVKDGVSWTDLFFNGSSIMGSFLNGLKSGWRSVKSFVSGIAGWIQKHKGPISYDAKLLAPAGNSIMNGLNSGLMKSFSTVQKNVSGMADKLSDSINSVAGDIKTGDLSMQAASYQGGSIDQNIDTNNWVKPTFVVKNELIGDKIYTTVKSKESRDYDMNKFFKH